jgi:opacity protein-like surface antigen
MNENGASIMIVTKCREVAVGIWLMGCLAVMCPTRAEGSEYVKNGYYLGVLFAYNDMSGNFSDSFAFRSESESDREQFVAPDVDDGAGFALVFGRRFDWISLELGYQSTTHDASSRLAGDNDATYSAFDVNVKIDVFAQDRLRPYVLLGGGLPWFDIENGRSEDDGVTWTEDAEYRGYCLNAGVGLAYYLHPQWAVMGGLIHRWNFLNHLKGDRIDDDLTERALGLTLGVAYTF